MGNRSPKLAAAIAAAIAVVAVVGLVVVTYRGAGGEPAAEPPIERLEGTPAPAGAGASPDTGLGGETEGSTQSPPEDGHEEERRELDPESRDEALATASGFVTAWLKPGEPDTRAEQIGRYATPALTSRTADIDLEALPIGDVGDAEVVEVGGQDALVWVPVGDLTVAVRLVAGVDGWQVVDFDRVDDEPTAEPGGDGG